MLIGRTANAAAGEVSMKANRDPSMSRKTAPYGNHGSSISVEEAVRLERLRCTGLVRELGRQHLAAVGPRPGGRAVRAGR
jgi:hypothetical protein